MTQRILTGVGIALALLLGQPGVLAKGASGQSRNDNRNGYSSSDAQQHGYEHGYRDGADRGRQDRERGLARDMSTNVYLEGSRDYDPSFGDRRQFMRGYQDGFKAGYDDGYGFYNRPGRYDQIYGQRQGSYGRSSDGRTSNRPTPSRDTSFDDGYRQGISAGLARVVNAPQLSATHTERVHVGLHSRGR